MLTAANVIAFLGLMLTAVIASVGASWALGHKIAKAEDTSPKHDHNGTYVRAKECELARENVHDKLENLEKGQSAIFVQLDAINRYLREERP